MYGDKFDGWGFCAVFCLNGLLLCAGGCIIVVGMEDRGGAGGDRKSKGGILVKCGMYGLFWAA